MRNQRSLVHTGNETAGMIWIQPVWIRQRSCPPKHRENSNGVLMGAFLISLRLDAIFDSPPSIGRHEITPGGATPRLSEGRNLVFPERASRNSTNQTW